METNFRTIAEKDHIPIIRRDTEDFLRSFIKAHKIKKVLEYGTAIGYSSLFFSEINDSITVYSVEKDEYAYEIAKHNLMNSASLKRIHLVQGDGLKLTDTIKKKATDPFDLVFIDGGKSHYKELFCEATKLCKNGGYILCDDIWQRGLTNMDPKEVPRKHRTSMRNMNKFLEYIQAASFLETEIMDIGDGLSISRFLGR